MSDPIITKNIVTSGNNAGVDQKNGTYTVLPNQRLPSNNANQAFQASAMNPTVAEWIRIAGSTIFQPILKYIDYSDKAIEDTKKSVETDTTARNPIQRLYLDTYNKLLVPAGEKYNKDVSSGQTLDKIRGAIEYSVVGAAASVPAVMMGIANIGNVKDGEGTENLVTNTIPNTIASVKENPEGFIASAAIAVAASKTLPRVPGAIKSTVKTPTQGTSGTPGTPKPKSAISTVIEGDSIKSSNLNVRSPQDFINNPSPIKQNPVKTAAEIAAEQTQIKNAHPNLNVVFPNEAVNAVKSTPVKRTGNLPAQIPQVSAGNLKVRSPQDFINNPSPIKQNPVKTAADILNEQNQIKSTHANLNVVFPNEAVNAVKSTPVKRTGNLPAQINPIESGKVKVRTPQDFINNPSPIKQNPVKTAAEIAAEQAQIRNAHPNLKITFPDSTASAVKSTPAKQAGNLPAQIPQVSQSKPKQAPAKKPAGKSISGLIKKRTGTARKSQGSSASGGVGRAGGYGYTPGLSNKNKALMGTGAVTLIAALPNQDKINTLVSDLITNTIKADSTETYPSNIDKTIWDKDGKRIVGSTDSGINGNRDASGEIVYNSFSNSEIESTGNKNYEIDSTGNRYPYSRKTGTSNEIESPSGNALISSEINPNRMMNAFPAEISTPNKTISKTRERTEEENREENKNKDEYRYPPKNTYEYETEYPRLPTLKRRKLSDDGSDSPRRTRTKKGRRNVQIVNYLPWLSDDDVESDNFSWLKRDLTMLKTPARIKAAGTAAVKKAVAEYNAAAKAYNAARKKLLKTARAGTGPESKRAYAELKRLYKSAKSLKTAAQKRIKAYRI